MYWSESSVLGSHVCPPWLAAGSGGAVGLVCGGGAQPTATGAGGRARATAGGGAAERPPAVAQVNAAGAKHRCIHSEGTNFSFKGYTSATAVLLMLPCGKRRTLLNAGLKMCSGPSSRFFLILM